ncbi:MULTISPECIES: hypothetical protein [Luteimonas]|uniref:hypothetical protein n=1 Tax=Luteimonas TaxID=83614 RepID=UPI00117EF011|nr:MULTISPECIES: hypothetical protein [Luteimonas]
MGSPGNAFIAAVDEFMAAPKELRGKFNPRWQAARDSYGLRLKLPIEIDGELPGQTLAIDAYPGRDLLLFNISLIVENRCVCRLDYDLEAIHDNRWASHVPGAVMGPHWHSWEVNRENFRKLSSYPVRLHHAIPYDEARAFDASLRWYCQERNIDLGAHSIIFPASDTLQL